PAPLGQLLHQEPSAEEAVLAADRPGPDPEGVEPDHGQGYRQSEDGDADTPSGGVEAGGLVGRPPADAHDRERGEEPPARDAQPAGGDIGQLFGHEGGVLDAQVAEEQEHRAEPDEGEAGHPVPFGTKPDPEIHQRSTPFARQSEDKIIMSRPATMRLPKTNPSAPMRRGERIGWEAAWRGTSVDGGDTAPDGSPEAPAPEPTAPAPGPAANGLPSPAGAGS